MGKVLASGHAEKEIMPDCCKIALTVETEESTAAKATASALTEFEKLLTRLAHIGIQPERLAITDDNSRKPYNRREGGYTSKKTVRLQMPVDVPLINRIHNIIAGGFENITMNVSFDLKAREQIMRDLTTQAIQDSRRTAELLTKATGMTIVGIKAANLTGNDDMDMDIANLDMAITDDLENRVVICGSGIDTPLSDRLNPEKITLSADVKIVWLVE